LLLAVQGISDEVPLVAVALENDAGVEVLYVVGGTSVPSCQSNSSAQF
jgi:hypothetical protein